MRKLALLTALSAVILGAMASSALAFPIRVSPGGAITATGPFAISGAFGVTVRCNLTLSGSLNTSIATVGSQAGSITGIRTANCTNPVTILNLPWRIIAQRLLGDSPLTGILGYIENAQFNVSGLPLVGTCLFRGNINILVPLSSSIATTVTTLSSTLSGACGLSGTVAAGQTFALSPAQTITR